MHISFSYAKIFSQSGSKEKEKERKKERLKVVNNYGHLGWRTQGAWAKKREREIERKLVITMASYALQRHLGWRTQSHLGQKYDSNA